MTPQHSRFPFQIGSANGTSTPGFFFNGVIDELDLYNRALTPSEIQSIFNAGSAGKCKPTVTWTQLSPTVSPPPRFAASMAYDAADGYVLLFGGYNHTSFHGDTWEFNAGSWTQLFPSMSPPPRYYASMTYDTADGYVLLFGGGNSGGLLSDTWEFKAGTWTQLSPSVSPSPRESSSMAYDATDGHLLLFGEVNTTAAGFTILGDTWKFQSGSWTQLFPSISPSPRASSSMAFDGNDGYILLFGGEDVIAGTSFQGDTWKFGPITAVGAHSTTTDISCDAAIVINQASTCTATVTDKNTTSPSNPTGTVLFNQTTLAAGSFTSNPCTLSQGTNPVGTATCSVTLTSTAVGGAYVNASYTSSDPALHSNSNTTSPYVILVGLRSVSVTVSCTSPVALGTLSTCNVAVADTSPGVAITPTGTLSMSTNSTGSFGGDCLLSGSGGSASCMVTYAPTVAGGHNIMALYPGDTNHVAVSNTFDITVNGKATPTIASAVTPSSITIGGSASDLATVSGGSTPTGTVTYTAYNDSACTNRVFTSSSIPLGASSASFTPSRVGTYLWIASYSGDASNNAVSTTCGAASETLAVSKATPAISSTVTPASI